MYDKAKLGTRYVCFQCGTKFYDLNRPEPTCPECSADQREAPRPSIKALLSSGRRTAPLDDEDDATDGDEDDYDLDVEDEDDDDLGDDDDDDDDEGGGDDDE